MFSLQTVIILKFNQTNSKINFSIFFFLFLMGDNIKVLFKRSTKWQRPITKPHKTSLYYDTKYWLKYLLSAIQLYHKMKIKNICSKLIKGKLKY